MDDESGNCSAVTFSILILVQLYAEAKDRTLGRDVLRRRCESIGEFFYEKLRCVLGC